MISYVKIETPYKRDERGTKKLIEGEFRNDAVSYLSNVMWNWTEKIDGTNIGVVWDGHSVTFQGRTERALIPSELVNRLNELFGGNVNEELFEQKFGETKVILFGEGFGRKIQKGGGNYIPDGVDFILFDVYLPDSDLWLQRDAIEDIASVFNIRVVPMIMTGTVKQAVEFIKEHPKSTIGNAMMEGLVGTPICGLKDRQGKRIITKVKVCDF